MGPHFRGDDECIKRALTTTLQFRRGKGFAMAMTVELPLEQNSAGLPQAGHAAPAVEAPRVRSRWSALTRPALGLLLPVGIALVWELIVWRGWSNGRLVPPPSKVF